MPESRRILIVEDEEGLAIHLQFLLKRLEYTPLEAVADGEQAVERAGVLRPDLVLMDIHLAGQMDGIEAARLIRDRYDVPVIFLTALAEDATIREAACSDPYGYLLKPVKQTDLRVAIEMALYKHQMETRLRESEQRYRLMFTQMSDGFGLAESVFDESGQPVDYRFITFNPAFERMIRVSQKRLVGRTMREALPGFDGESLIQAFGQVALTGKPAHFEYHFKPRDRFLEISAYQTNARQFACVVKDVTERKRAELALCEREEQLRDSYFRAEQNLRRMTILRNIDLAITTHNDLPVMAGTILSHMTDLIEIDGAALFVPTPAAPHEAQEGGEASAAVLRLVGLSGFSSLALDNPVHDWQQSLVSQVYQTAEEIHIAELAEDPHPGAQEMARRTGFHSCAVLPLVARGQVKGVLQFFCRQPGCPQAGDSHNFLQSLALQMAIAIDNVDMFEDLKRSNRELARAYEQTIKGWAEALELRDKETRGHSERVTRLAEKLARAMGIEGAALEHFRRGVLLHDIGKMGVPDTILNKPTTLTPDEWVTMRQHVIFGYDMLSGIEYLRPALDVVCYHHEKWDGTGYPSGLREEEIPLTARIFAVVDVYDALTSDRVYRPAWPKSDAVNYIRQQSGQHFDPAVVEVFLGMVA